MRKTGGTISVDTTKQIYPAVLVSYNNRKTLAKYIEIKKTNNRWQVAV
jgi:hypothetical protein